MKLDEHRKGIRRLEEIRAKIGVYEKAFSCKDFTLHSQNNCEFRMEVSIKIAHDVVESSIANLITEFNVLAKDMRVDDGLSLSVFTAQRHNQPAPPRKEDE